MAVDLRWGDRRHVAVGGVSIHVETTGAAPADGAPTLVCLHGFASGTATWAGVVAELPGVHVVAWDRPPFGRSERPAPRTGSDDPYSAAAELDRTAELVDRLAGPGPTVVVGHSAGALVAVQAALDRRVAVDALVLVAPALDGGPPGAVRAAARLPGAGLVAPSLLRVGVLGAATFLRRTTRHATPLTEATAADTGRTLRRPGTAAALWHITTTWEPPAVLHRLGELDLPTVVVGGVEDRIVSAPALRAVAEGSRAELHLLEHAGHAPHEQRPDEVAAVIRGLLARLDGAGRDGGAAGGRW